MELLATGSRFVCGEERVSEFTAKVVRIVAWADRTRHPGDAPQTAPPPVAPPPPPPEPERPAQGDDGGMLTDMARHSRSVTLDVLAAGNRALKWRDGRKQQEEYERAHQQWQQQHQYWEQQQAAYEQARQEWDRQQQEAQRRFELEAAEQRQPNPLVVLIGAPHSGQRRLFRNLLGALDAEGVEFADPVGYSARNLLLDVDRSDWPADAVVRHFVADCDKDNAKISGKPSAVLVEESDELFGSRSGDIANYLTELAHDQQSCRLVGFAGTPEFLDQIATSAPELMPRLLVYRMPDMSQPPSIGALLDVLAGERSMVLTAEAREGLASLAADSGAADDAREAESLLAAVSQSALGRGATRDGKVHIESADVEQLAATTEKRREGEKTIEELLTELDAMIGLDSVKDRVRALANEMAIDAQRKQAGLPVAARSRHLVFTGNPGTAKTTVARLVAQIYHGLGVLPKGQVIEVTRTDLVSEYVGQTSIKTRGACERAMGGVLFLDEAYNLVSDSENDFGKEAVTELLLQMENHRDDFIVFAAGYPKEMDRFMESNPGLRSRFAGKVDFPDYTNDELAGIFQLMAKSQGYQLSEEFGNALPEAIRRIPRGRGFANGRSARALLEAAISKQSSRLAAEAAADPAALALLTPADLPAGGESGVGQADDSGPRRSLEELLAELDAMIGLDPVKQRVRALVAETQLDMRRREAGLPVAGRSRHLVFTGNPGTAKTTVARLMGQIYRELGVLPSGHLVEVARPDLVGEFIGQTAPKTRDVCERAIGGVLFLDEAYNLVSDSENDFGKEAVTELLLQMENHRDDLIVITAGYPKEMDRFMESNPGLRSRFAGKVDFPDYTNDELAGIFALMAKSQGYQLSDDFGKVLPEAIRRIPRGRGFANGRSARGLLESAISKQSTRLAAQPDADPATLGLLTPADLPAGGESGVGQADDAGPRRSLAELLAELDTLVGLDPVKQRVRALVAETRLDMRRREAGLPVAGRSRHLVFTGNPGSAKTTVARLMGQIYRELGVLPSGHLVEVGRPDMVGEFLGQTAPKTRDVCERAIGGLLFIDEAYNLAQQYNSGEDTYGKEAIAELLVQMENHRDDLIVIAAGYPGDMDRFLDANEGLRSRFGGTVEFPDYSNDELAAIFTVMASKQGYQLAPEVVAALPRLMAGIDRDKGFANGRSARGLLERAISAQAMRLAGPDTDLAKLANEELTLLTAADLPA